MRWNRPTTLSTSVEVASASRPIRIAYLIPLDDVEVAQRVLDATFYESYTRWAGAYTLMVPMAANAFVHEDFSSWLAHFDPDFIYTYCDIAPEMVEAIDHLCSPIAFLAHDRTDTSDTTAWREYLPRWERYFKPISSISTVRSPEIYRLSRKDRSVSELKVFTQQYSSPKNRVLADNFGVSFDLHTVTHEIPGLFRTFCLTSPTLPENIIVGSERCTSTLDAFKAISDRHVTTFSQLAMVHGDSGSHVQASSWGHAFRIFVGTSPIDRINFWNCRSLRASWSLDTNALVLDESYFLDDDLVHQLGHFLNRNNFLGYGNGPHLVSLHSAQYNKDALEEFASRLKEQTWNSVSVPSTFSSHVTPSQEDLKNAVPRFGGFNSFKLNETFTQVKAEEPAHLSFLDSQLKEVGRGQWIVELAIERHNNLSKYSNVVDLWVLPSRRRVTRAFTDGLARPTRQGRLALVPSSGARFNRAGSTSEPSYYALSLPSDEEFFRHLALDFFQYPEDDVRSTLEKRGYAELAVSDKGQNLRGVIAMFDQLATAYQVLGNAYWRKVLQGASEDAARPRTFSRDKLLSIAVDDRDSVLRITRDNHFKDIKETRRYLEQGLLDTLENLIRAKVFFQVFNWRCKYCGHANSKVFDHMRIENACEICATTFLAPVDLEWVYELNEFVYRSLKLNSGHPVLWTIGYLLDRSFSDSFWYLPEVDLYLDRNNHDKNEIDALCIVGGKFYAIEVKRTASIFLNVPGSIEKFCSIITRLRPDVAMLSFERYNNSDVDEEQIKLRLQDAAIEIRSRIAPWTELEIVVAKSSAKFDEVPYDLGWSGERIGLLEQKRATRS